MKMARQWSYSLVPSYLQSNHDDGRQTTKPQYATSALDGLRGIAALFVFFFHILFAYTDLVEYGYGQSPAQTKLIQLPVIRLVYSGHAMVMIFFVVGGYVFALKPLRLLRAGQQTASLNALVSSVFKRAIRLYAPAIIATFMTMVTIYAGLWEYQRQFIANEKPNIRFADHHIERSHSLGAQFLHWLHETLQLTNFMSYFPKGIVFEHYPQYDPHLWTVPIEYRSSLILAVLLLAISRCKAAARLLFLVTATAFAILWDHWELVCFLAGATLCEVDLATGAFGNSTEASSATRAIETKDEEQSSILPMTSRQAARSLRHASRAQIPQILLFVLALYLLSAPPQDMLHTPGYSLIFHLTPPTYTDPKRWPHTLGTVLLIATLGRSALLCRPFETDFAQYLGKISFSLYIVHGPLIHIVGFSVTPWIWTHVTGIDSGWRWCVGVFLGSVILAAVVAIVADWFSRVVERASIDWAQKLGQVCLVERTESRQSGIQAY